MSSIAILGAGRVGTTLASALAQAGHHVVVGVRDPEAAGLSWTGAPVTFTAVAAAIASSDIVLNATPGDTTLERLGALSDELAGKILIDVGNATTRGGDGIPGGLVYPNSSLGEKLQAALPRTHVVKTLNTMLFSAMAAPQTLGAAPTVFVSGDDTAAKAAVRVLLIDLGWTEEQILDLGAIETARGTEAVALLVPALLGVLGFAPFAFTIAR